MNNIINLDCYNESMRKTLLDKAFFIDKVDAKIFIDFGCGDGSLIHFLHLLFPNNIYFGYDINPDMIAIAKSKDDSFFTDSLEELKTVISGYTGKKCLILNSVIHEVYSYCTKEKIDSFYEFIYSNIFDYIAIRDMMMSKFIASDSNIHDNCLIRSVLDSGKLLTKYQHLQEFETEWGSIFNNKNFYHFLLKYRYLENWNRELKENYLPIASEEFLALVPSNYSIDYKQDFLLPFLKWKVWEDFGITLRENTHLKLILRKI